ncbi:MAG: DUF4252 domain-containing protein [Bacteroidales bacterium]|jgi:hypothetical protein|nr:DUF4252 domain-containing protein [Bacteroidales bacterium]
MKKLVALLLMVLFLGQSCITDQKRYKETDIFEEFETQQGFVVLHLPPVLFKLVLNLSEEKNQFNTDLTDKIEVIKIIFFEETKHTVSNQEVSQTLQQKAKDANYQLLTQIAQEGTNISIFIFEQDKIIHEILFTALSEKDYFGVNVVGNFTREEVLKIYQSINMQQVKSMGN